MTKTKTFNINIWRTVALTVSIIGAIVSLYFLLNAGRNQSSILLIMLFIGWVLIPFIGLFYFNKISIRWTNKSRKAFYWLTIILTTASLIGYSGVLTAPRTKLTFLFLVIPLISIIAIIITTLSFKLIRK
ncbi:MAG: hypothetical protein EKK37_12650 [Sphingobacteriales bacterium]|nr:MAG: hypothetical protein EKK37_12650 [Sphingobacteriales bacterium]